MDPSPNISFFIPAYNCYSTIEEAVESIIKTNFNDGDELVIVNDFSTDSTADTLADLKEKYPSISVINHTHNKGGGAARNTAIEACKNNLLFCLDSDNILEINSIKYLKEYLVDNNADVASFQQLRYFSKSITQIEDSWTLPEDEFTVADCFSKSFSPGSGGNYLFTKTSWLNAGGYPEFAGALDTWGFGMRQLMTNAKVIVLKDSYYFHRLSSDSYYLRDAWSRRKSVSVRALQLLIPFFDRINDGDIDYMMSKKHRFTWFENIDEHPIHLSDNLKINNSIWAKDIVTKSGEQNYFNRISSKISSLFR